MMDEFKGPIFAALGELDKKMKEENLPQIELKCVGGFALMLHGVRERDCITDVDYVGPDLSKKIVELSEEIGRKFNMPEKWINNDLLLTGTSLEDLEYSTGKLHFTKKELGFNRIKIEVLCLEDLLKMKVIAVDTNLVAIEYGGDFTRIKDYTDILKLMEKCNYTSNKIDECFGEYIVGRNTINSIDIYKKYGSQGINEMVHKIAIANAANNLKKNVNYERSSFIDNILNKAIENSR